MPVKLRFFACGIVLLMVVACASSMKQAEQLKGRGPQSRRGQILVVISSATKLPLASPESTPEVPVGFFLVELAKMLQTFEGQYDFVFATPDGLPPQLDINGLDLNFHVQGWTAPWLNTFTNLDPRRLNENTIESFRRKRSKEFQRRVTEIETAVKYLGRLNVTEPLANTSIEARAYRDTVVERMNSVSTKPYLSLREVVEQHRDPTSDLKLDQFDFIFVPGGHAPMVDLKDNPYLGEIYNVFHEKHKLIAAICHGPVSLASARFRIDERGQPITLNEFPLQRAKVTTVSSFEESLMLKVGYIKPENSKDKAKLKYFVDEALKNAGYQVEYGSPMIAGLQASPGFPHVVYDSDHRILTANGPQTMDAMMKKLVSLTLGNSNSAEHTSDLNEVTKKVSYNDLLEAIQPGRTLDILPPQKNATDSEVLKGVMSPALISPRIKRAQQILIRDSSSYRTVVDSKSRKEPKMLHPHGVCASASWSITKELGYTGIFASRSFALPAIIRLSPAGNNTSPHAKIGDVSLKIGIHRMSGLALKIFPTTSADLELSPFNILTFDQMGPDGNPSPWFLRNSNVYAENSQFFSNWMFSSKKQWLKQPPQLNNRFAAQFGDRWKELKSENDKLQVPSSQLVPLDEGGKIDPDGSVINTARSPRFIKFRLNQNSFQRSLQKKSAQSPPEDVRDELLEYEAGEIVFDIILVSETTPEKIEPSQEIAGQLRLGKLFKSESCDFALRFFHPSSVIE